ncbi:hypothetical protein [Mycobacteroides abscessus]|uniref:hypothetical protein n=1 Tax=Mycobacteroides abscessus TaxID=36809 RepID=UPI00092839F9|nr:hypothetical protein [Mycobacteroides abscessus]WJJ55441.1 head-to-tail adaptor [Mycobacterium phage prophiT49-2]MDB2213852.1 hypothetical protein [Mycobacteroides abscessus subsp. massiliense]SHT11614.1 Uncharacterised protein [Mycobacteroides abscessus subsp. abscessus]SKO61841.1 Uncharacterised protein [Mycobacteroides abscessus subsp. abscessus]SKU88127.1 Uncharacterised protein [Mycobacteroides abscessus subsp. massiliense]
MADDFPDQLATADELATWMGVVFDDDDKARARFILRVASGWARMISGKLWPDRDTVSVTVRGIVAAAARREFENPRHVTYEVKGPESASYDRLAYPNGFFTDAEKAFLQKYRPSGQLWVQGTCRDDMDMVLGYVRILGFDKPLPYFNPWDPGWMESEHL